MRYKNIHSMMQKAVCVISAISFFVTTAGCSNFGRGVESMTEGEKGLEAELTKKQEQNLNGVTGKRTAVFEAAYPEMAKYPTVTDWDYNEAEYDAWRDSKKEIYPDTEEYKEGIRQFSEKTMKEFLTGADGENKIYSPVNIYMALAMLAEITFEESRTQILQLLGQESMEELRKNANNLWRAHYCDDGTATSILASSLWMNDVVHYKEDTLKLLAENYYASSFYGVMGSEEYDKALQDWLNEQTGGLLGEHVANIKMDPETILTLATTVYYKVRWQKEFDPENTREDIFYTPDGKVQCDFMTRSDSMNYFWGNKFSAITKNFKNSGEMLFILPDEGISVEELLTEGDVLAFITAPYKYENSKYLIVDQQIPKFDVSSELELKKELVKLGVTDVFDFGASNFTALTEDETVAVSEVKHAARVTIDEEGCTAAAFTLIPAFGAAAPPEERVDFILNRPFLFVINGRDGQPLFIGIVNQP